MYQTARRTNAYTKALGQVYRNIPKSVWASLAYSYAAGEHPDQDPQITIDSLLCHWKMLEDQGLLQPDVRRPQWRRVRTHAPHALPNHI